MVDIFDNKGNPIVDRKTGAANYEGDPNVILCVETNGRPPLCQRACPHDALVRIDLSTPDQITNWSKR